MREPVNVLCLLITLQWQSMNQSMLWEPVNVVVERGVVVRFCLRCKALLFFET